MDSQQIAEQSCILRGTVGSTLHGLSLEGHDDCDEMGVCIEPQEYVIGLQHFEQWVHRTKPEGVKSKAGDLDLTIYSLRKWCSLALRGNPTILLLLFVPEQFCSIRTTLGIELQKLAPLFVARSVAAPYLGYMVAQLQRLTGERGQMRVKRPDLIEAHGYDTKYAMHVLRLGIQGIELLSTGSLTLPMQEIHRQALLGVRKGEMELQEVLTWAGTLRRELKELGETSTLPLISASAQVDMWLCKAYNEWWGSK